MCSGKIFYEFFIFLINSERGCRLELFMRGCFERNGSVQNGSKRSCKREAIRTYAEFGVCNYHAFHIGKEVPQDPPPTPFIYPLAFPSMVFGVVSVWLVPLPQNRSGVPVQFYEIDTVNQKPDFDATQLIFMDGRQSFVKPSAHKSFLSLQHAIVGFSTCRTQ